MRRLFLPALVAAGVLLAIQALSLFTFLWLSSDRSTRLGLSQGCLHVWRGQPGDFLSGQTGVSIHGWSAHDLLWEAELSPNTQVWVATMPTGATPGTPARVRQITGASAMLPLLYPLLLAAAAGGAAYLPWRRHHRIVRGLCPKCRYSQDGLITPRCPECGVILRHIRRWLRSWLPRLAAG